MTTTTNNENLRNVPQSRSPLRILNEGGVLSLGKDPSEVQVRISGRYAVLTNTSGKLTGNTLHLRALEVRRVIMLLNQAHVALTGKAVR